MISNAPVDYTMNSGVLRHSIVVGVLCPDGHELRLSNFIAGFKKTRQSNNSDLLILFPGFFEALRLDWICQFLLLIWQKLALTNEKMLTELL